MEEIINATKISPKNINSLNFQSLKACGLSRQKVKGIKDLAKKYLNRYDYKNNLTDW